MKARHEVLISFFVRRFIFDGDLHNLTGSTITRNNLKARLQLVFGAFPSPAGTGSSRNTCTTSTHSHTLTICV